MSREWVNRPERSTVGIMRFIVWIARTFGRSVTRLLLYPICIYFILFSAKERRASRNYLTRVLGRRAGLADIFRHYFSFSATILDRVFLLSGQRELFDIRLHGEQAIKKVMAERRGFILISAHMGSFEVMHALGRDLGGIEAAMVMYEENAQKLGTVLKSINPESNPVVIPLGRVDSMLKIQERLGRGECIGMLADRTFTGEKTIACEFLGGTMVFPLGPFRLAAMLQRPLILMLGLYQGDNRYDVYVEELGELQQENRPGRDAAISGLVQHYAARLEHYCRMYPYNWFNFYDVWK